jgi:hypothetical protein
MIDDKQWKPPGFMKKVAGFTVAFAKWRAAGYPRRSPGWVRELFQTHCQGGDGPACEWYNADEKTPLGDVGVCTRCGCHVGEDAENMMNKLVMPTNACPIGKFPADVEKTPETPLQVLKRLKKK